MRANKLNRTITSGGRDPKIGIITAGKSYLDVRQAFDELGIDEIKCNALGIRLYKVGCVWPSSRGEFHEFAEGLDLNHRGRRKALVARSPVREELYSTPNQPLCIGKKDEQGNWLFPVKGALDPNEVAICIGDRLLKYHRNDGQRTRRPRRNSSASPPKPGTWRNAFPISAPAARIIPRPWCRKAARLCGNRLPLHGAVDGPLAPRLHPDGRRRRRWIGEAPFTNATTCSPISATAPITIPAAWRSAPRSPSNTNITYKILFNDAVAMTGGQPVDGDLTVPQVARQVAAEGAKRVVVVTDEPDKYPRDTAGLPA